MRSSRSRRTALAARATRATRTTWSTRRTTTAARCCWLLSRRRAPAMARRSLSGSISPSLARVTIEAEPFESPDARRLIAELDAHLASRYPPEQRFGPNLKPAQIAPGIGTFVIARADGKAVGCGALRVLDETTAEVKRMYVEPALRGRGVAKEMLEHLEAVAATMGAHKLVLETGVYQEEAIGLYVRAGFRQIDCGASMRPRRPAFATKSSSSAPARVAAPRTPTRAGLLRCCGIGARLRPPRRQGFRA